MLSVDETASVPRLSSAEDFNFPTENANAQSTGCSWPKHARLCELARTEQLRVLHKSVQQLLAVAYCGIHVN